MVQTEFRYFLSLEERQQAFNYAVGLVARSFPPNNQTVPTKTSCMDTGNQCNRCLQHVLILKDYFKEDQQLRKRLNIRAFCELLKECSR